MDLHATTSTIDWLDHNGQWLGECLARSTPEALQRAISKIPGTHKKLVFEPSSHACWAADALQDHVDELHVSDPRYNGLISKCQA